MYNMLLTKLNIASGAYLVELAVGMDKSYSLRMAL
jgi:hypothetical protein